MREAARAGDCHALSIQACLHCRAVGGPEGFHAPAAQCIIRVAAGRVNGSGATTVGTPWHGL